MEPAAPSVPRGGGGGHTGACKHLQMRRLTADGRWPCPGANFALLTLSCYLIPKVKGVKAGSYRSKGTGSCEAQIQQKAESGELVAVWGQSRTATSLPPLSHSSRAACRPLSFPVPQVRAQGLRGFWKKFCTDLPAPQGLLGLS